MNEPSESSMGNNNRLFQPDEHPMDKQRKPNYSSMPGGEFGLGLLMRPNELTEEHRQIFIDKHVWGYSDEIIATNRVKSLNYIRDSIAETDAVMERLLKQSRTGTNE